MGAIYSLLLQWEPSFSFALGCLDEEVQTKQYTMDQTICWFISRQSKCEVLLSGDVANMQNCHVCFWFVIAISKNRRECSRRGVEQTSAFPLLFVLSLSLSGYLHELKLNRPILQRFYDQLSWSVTPNQHWLAEWRQVARNIRQTIQIRSWTLELIANIQQERRQSVSLRFSVSPPLLQARGTSTWQWISQHDLHNWCTDLPQHWHHQMVLT